MADQVESTESKESKEIVQGEYTEVPAPVNKGTEIVTAMPVVTVNLPARSMSGAEILKLFKGLDDIYKNVLQLDVDYGIISGTKKPSLYKTGATSLMLAFGLTAKFNLVEKEITLDPPYAYFHYNCKIYTLSGIFLGEGEGSCNSYEDKYRWRWCTRSELKSLGLIDPNFPSDQDPPNMVKKWFQSPTGAYAKFRVDNENPLNQLNTFKKMALKRAHTDAVLRVTGADRIFSQDLEDIFDFDTGEMKDQARDGYTQMKKIADAQKAKAQAKAQATATKKPVTQTVTQKPVTPQPAKTTTQPPVKETVTPSGKQEATTTPATKEESKSTPDTSTATKIKEEPPAPPSDVVEAKKTAPPKDAPASSKPLNEELAKVVLSEAEKKLATNCGEHGDEWKLIYHASQKRSFVCHSMPSGICYFDKSIQPNVNVAMLSLGFKDIKGFSAFLKWRFGTLWSSMRAYEKLAVISMIRQKQLTPLDVKKFTTETAKQTEVKDE